MTFISKNFKWFLVLAALGIGVLYVAPQLLIWRSLEKAGQPYVVIQLTHHSDEAYGHMAFAREIYDGRFPPGDLYFSEKTPSLFSPFPIPYMLMAFFIWLFHGSVNAAYTAAHFVIPAVLFCLFVWLGLVVTRRQSWALAIGFVSMLTPIVNHLPDAFRSVSNFLNIAVKNFYPLIKTPLPDLFLARTMDPLLTYLIFIPVITLLLIVWRTTGKKTAIWTGAAVGALYYTYFHYWVYITIVVGLLGLIALIQRKQSPERWRAMLWLAGVAALATIPYWINFFRYMVLPTAQEVTDGLGTMEYSRSLRLLRPFSVLFDYVFYLVSGAVVYWLWWRKKEYGDRQQAILYWVFLGAMFVAWNVQVVIGYVPQPDHWFRTFSPFIFVIGIHALYKFLRRVNQRAVAIGLVVLSLLLVVKKINNVLIFVNPPAQTLADYTFNPNIVDSWKWINEHVAGEPVIASPSFVSSLYFTTQTTVRPYLATRVNSSVANTVLEGRFLKTFKVFGVSTAMMERLLRSDSTELCSAFVDCTVPNTNDTQNWLKVPRNLYSSYYRNRIDLDTEPVFRSITKEKATELVRRYQAMSAVSFADLEADYVYYGPWERQFVKTDLSYNPHLVLVYKNPEVELYQIKR